MTTREAKTAWEKNRSVTLKKWTRITLVEAKAALTIEEALEVYKNAPDYGEYWEDPSFFASRKVDELCKRDLEQADTLEKILRVWKLTIDSSLCDWAREKYDRLYNKEVVYKLKTLEEAKVAYFYAIRNHLGNSAYCAQSMWGDFSRQEIEQAKTAKEAKVAWSRCPNGRLPGEALEKWEIISLREVRRAKTIEDLGEAWRDAPEGSRPRKIANRRINKLVLANPEW